MLFGCQHQDSEAERSSDEHLNENALSTIDIRGKHRAKSRLAKVIIPRIAESGSDEKEEEKKGKKRQRKYRTKGGNSGRHLTRTCTQVDRG